MSILRFKTFTDTWSYVNHVPHSVDCSHLVCSLNLNQKQYPNPAIHRVIHQQQLNTREKQLTNTNGLLAWSKHILDEFLPALEVLFTKPASCTFNPLNILTISYATEISLMCF